MPAQPDPRIDLLPELVSRLPDDLRSQFHAIYNVHRDEGRLRVPPEMTSWVEERFGPVPDVQAQRIVRVVNRYTLEAASFNSLRARRPLTTHDAAARGAPSSALPDPADDPLADPLALTPESVVGRVRGRRCVTAANVAMSDAWHALVVFDEPDPLRFDANDVEDYLSTALRWAHRVHERDREALHPFILWNATWRAGASLAHGHAQVLLAKSEPYARVEALRRAAAQFREERGRDYFASLVDVHNALGLGLDVDNVPVFAHLTPVKEKEVLLFGHALDADFFRTVGRVLVAYRDHLGAESFNVAVYGPPLTEGGASWEGFPVVAHLVDRGSLGVRTSDIAGMELFAQSVVAADPFQVAERLRHAL